MIGWLQMDRQTTWRIYYSDTLCKGGDLASLAELNFFQMKIGEIIIIEVAFIEQQIVKLYSNLILVDIQGVSCVVFIVTLDSPLVIYITI